MKHIDLRDKFKGCIVGSAIGDALGYEVEFLSMAGIRERHGGHGIQTLVLQKLDGDKVALYSDDTQMSRAVCEGLVAGGRFATLDTTGVNVAIQFVRWYRSAENNRAPGSACMAGCLKLDKSDLHWRECGGGRTNDDNGGCGSVMRSHPYGLFYFDDRDLAVQTAAEHSLMTHGAPLAQAASAALAAGVWAALRNYELPRISSMMQDAAYLYDQDTGDMLVQAEAMATDPEVQTSDVLDMWRGWSGHEAIAGALYCFLRYVHTGHDTVVIAAANSPGDSDSIAAIAGALAGALVGFGGLRADWVKDVEKTDELQTLATRLLDTSTKLTTLHVLEDSHAAPYPD